MHLQSRDAFAVLVVDDDPLVQRIVGRALTAGGYGVRAAATGAEALAEIAQAPPDLVLLDVELPDRSGTSVCAELRRTHPPEALPILMLTGRSDDPAVEAAFEAGATDFLTKPVSLPLLRQRLRFALRAVSAFQRLEASERRLERGHELAGIGQFEWDEGAQRLDFTPQALRILGRPEFLPATLAEWIVAFVAPEDREKAVALFAGAPLADPELRLAGKEPRTIRALVERRSTPNGAVLSVTIHDVTEFVGDRIHKLAHYDGVTGLPNRQLFERRLDAALASGDARRFAVLFVDIDGFKETNDTLGHAAGDELLRHVAERLLGTLRLNDAIGRLRVEGSAGRWGGDEFAVLLGPVTRVDAERVAQRILRAAEAPVLVGGKERSLRLSIGLALSPDHGRTRYELMRSADRAMYEAKRDGGNQVRVFEPLMEARAKRRAVIEADVSEALSRRELHLVYQPRFALDTLAIRSAEALLRWRHPQLGAVPPGEFVPVAEKTRAIVGMGAWALEAATTALARWRAAGFPDLHLSVNLSAVQIQDGEFARRLSDALLASQIPPAQLELEITESMMLDASDVATRNLEAIAALGVGLSIDDFGTGYSSLAALLTVPLQAVKLDRSIVQQLPTTASARSVVRAMVAMCRGMSCKLVAEGIESESELEILRELGCTEGQGYWFSEPLAPEKLEERLRGAQH